ncbi:MAG: LysR family transcriptional regulator [Candidatus Thorarchaeota archaeon]
MEKDRKSRLRLRWKIWFEITPQPGGDRITSGDVGQAEPELASVHVRRRPVFGAGVYVLLKSIHETGAITGGARALGMSYRYAWGLIRDVERELGVRLLNTRRGGMDIEHGAGGGGSEITEEGYALMRLYSESVRIFADAASNVEQEFLDKSD